MDVINQIHPGEILRCEVGSTLHGIGIGSDDLDLMGITVEPPNVIFGTEGFEQIVQRTAEEGERSGPNDTDITVYGLKKWMRLALQGNPSVIVLLYAPKEFYYHLNNEGIELIDLRDSIVSARCIGRFLGYMNGQRQRALKGKGSGNGNREGRREKWASHMVRLGHQGLELAARGTLTLPMPEHAAERCKAIKRGEIAFDDALAISLQLEGQIEHIKNENKIALADKPDMERVHKWMTKTYLKTLA